MIAILTLSYVFSFSFTLAFHKNGINLRSISTFFLQNRIQIETISSLTCNVKIMTLNLSMIIIDFHFGWIDCFRSREFIIDTHVNIFRCSSMQKISIKRSERWTFFFALQFAHIISLLAYQTHKHLIRAADKRNSPLEHRQYFTQRIAFSFTIVPVVIKFVSISIPHIHLFIHSLTDRLDFVSVWFIIKSHKYRSLRVFNITQSICRGSQWWYISISLFAYVIEFYQSQQRKRKQQNKTPLCNWNFMIKYMKWWTSTNKCDHNIQQHSFSKIFQLKNSNGT